MNSISATTAPATFASAGIPFGSAASRSAAARARLRERVAQLYADRSILDAPVAAGHLVRAV